MIGAKLPPYSRIWRKLAEMPSLLKRHYAHSGQPCEAALVSSVPQNLSAGMYHFRTPSPGGQQSFSNTLLPAFFRACSPFAEQADLCPTRQIGAHLTLRVSRRLTFDWLRLSTKKTSKGKTLRALVPSCLHALQHLDLRHVATLLANRPSSVAQWAQARPLLPVAALQPALRSALQETSLRVSSTSWAANARTSHHLTSQNRRRASPHGGVLHFLHNSSEAPCSKSF